MAFHTPLWQQNEDYTAAEDRGVFALAPGVGPLSPDDLVVSQRATGANLSVDVSAGRAIIPAATAARGRYLVHSDAVENVPLGTAPGAGSSRIDRIIARVHDTEYDGPGDGDEWYLQVVPGTPAASPTVPAMPAGVSAVELARVAVGESVVAISDGDITDRRSFASPVVYLADSVMPVAGHDGQIAVSASGRLSHRVGGTWTTGPTTSQFRISTVSVGRGNPAGTTPTMLPHGSSVSASVAAGTVSVSAVFTGDIYNASSPAASSWGAIAIEISLNGGTSWTRGNNRSASALNWASGSDPEQPIAASFVRTGTTTGTVQARVQAMRNSGESWQLGGDLVLTVMPG